MRVKIIKDAFQEGILGLKVNVHEVLDDARPFVYIVKQEEFNKQGVYPMCPGGRLGLYSFEVKEIITCR